jgi:hypothetical protein
VGECDVRDKLEPPLIYKKVNHLQTSVLELLSFPNYLRHTSQLIATHQCVATPRLRTADSRLFDILSSLQCFSELTGMALCVTQSWKARLRLKYSVSRDEMPRFHHLILGAILSKKILYQHGFDS